MARTDTLGHFLTDVADAIREKKGTSETIQASEFDTEIANLPSGGDLNDYFKETITYGTTSIPGFLSSLKKLPAFSFSGSNANYMFKNFKGETLDLSKFNTTYCNQMAGMFDGCTNLKKLDLSNFVVNTNSLNLNYWLNNCIKLEILDVRNMNLTKSSSTNGVLTGIPADCEIIVKDTDNKNWFLSRRSDLTNVKTVEEYEAEQSE